MKVRPVAIALCLTVFIFLESCGGASLSRVRGGGALRVGYAVEAPYAFIGPEGELTGESPEIVRLIAARIGIRRIEWRQFEFSSLLPELESGSIDLVAAGLFVTEERQKRVAFSLPTFTTSEGLLVAAGNPRGLHSYRELALAEEAKVACLAGAVEYDALRAAGLPDSRILQFPDAVSAKAAVASGLALALALSGPTVRWMAMEDAGRSVEAAEPFLAESGEPPSIGAFAFRRSDRALLRAWNEALEPFIRSPEHLALVTPFGFTAENLPPPPAAARRR